MDDSQLEANNIDFLALKNRISAVNTIPLSEHSKEFDQIHQLLQRALSNLDGV